MTLIMEECPENSEMVGINILLKEVEATEEGLKEGPFNQVVLQECTRMNVLINEIRRSLIELDKGLKGQLNMSQPMEDLIAAISINQWPGRNPFSQCKWEAKAWPSMKNMISQFADMMLRIAQLVTWSTDLVT